MIERDLSERYRPEGLIGQGGMATVYAGVDTVLRRRVAIKVLREALAADNDFVQRFYTEAQHAAKLSHPNIVNIYDVGREGERYCIVMELVDGATLAEMIEKDGVVPEPVAIDFAAQVCSGLAYAHRQGLLHRDVKPANILVTRDDVVKLSDFGIARAVTTQTMAMTQPGMVMGSVYYISPEQAQGLEMRDTSDLYSLGVVLYQMLTGKLPYQGESPVTIALKHVTSPIPDVDADDVAISPALAAIVRKLLQKDPRDRFQSAVEVAKALREARERPNVSAPFEPAAREGFERSDIARGVIPNPKPRPSRAPDRTPAREAMRGAAAPEDVLGAGVVERRSYAGRVLFAVVAAVALAAAIAAGYYANVRPGGMFGRPTTISLGSFVGRTADEAEKRLDMLGVRYNVVPVASETVPANRIVRQDPGPTKRLPAQATVQLYVSNGLPTVALVDVRQYSSDDAQRYLRNAKLVPKIVEQFDTSPRGTVLSERPAPGANVAIHSVVALTVSKGRKPVYVPEVVSQSIDDAKSAVADRDLKLVVSERDPSDDIPADVITSQNPLPGVALDPGSTVSVTVSSGPPLVSVPNVTGKLIDAVTPLLANAGLQSNVEYLVDASTAPGMVVKQDPQSSASLKKGAGITLDVAVPGTIPDVAGKSPDAAATLLLDSGYKIGNRAYVQEGADGTVARTEPTAGTTLHPGETVTLYVNGTSQESP